MAVPAAPVTAPPPSAAVALEVAPAARPIAQSSNSTAQPDADADGVLTHLEGRSGSPDALWADASYKVKREGGKVTKTLKVRVLGAPAGAAQALSCDGFKLGKLVPSVKGKAEFEMIEAGEDYFPDGFEAPRRGSVVKIGELLELSLEPLEKLADLRADIAGPGKLEGKVDFKIERLAGTVTREFEIKVTHAVEKSVHAIKLDGVHVADLNVDLAGKGKLLFSTLEGTPFPDAFRDPHAGSRIEIEGIFAGELHDVLEANAH